MLSFLLFSLNKFALFFSSFLRQILVILRLSSLIVYALKAINFSVSKCTLIVSLLFCRDFVFQIKIFYNFHCDCILIMRLFKYRNPIYGFFLFGNFLMMILLLVFSIIPLVYFGKCSISPCKMYSCQVR